MTMTGLVEIGVARALRLDRPVVVGHSMGAVHAALAALELDVRAPVLEDPHWPEIAEDGTKDVAASRRTVVETAALSDADRWTFVRVEHPAWDDVDLRAWVRARAQVDPGVVTWFHSWPATNRWREHVAPLGCPGLLLTGDRSPTVTVRPAAQARQRWPQVDAVQIEGAGHDVRRDRFGAYWEALTRFLSALNQRRTVGLEWRWLLRGGPVRDVTWRPAGGSYSGPG